MFWHPEGKHTPQAIWGYFVSLMGYFGVQYRGLLFLLFRAACFPGSVQQQSVIVIAVLDARLL